MLCKYCKQEIPEASKYCCFCGKPQQKLAKPKHRHANGEGCVFKRDGKRTWTAQITDWARSEIDLQTGKLKRRYKEKNGFPTEASARAWCVLQYAAQHESQEKPKAPVLEHYWKLYSSGEMLQLSPSKKTAYQIAWKKLSNLSQSPVDAITIADLRQAVSENATSYYTARDMKVLLSHLFNLASADDYCKKDLPSYIVLPKLEEKEKEVFTLEEQKKLWSAFSDGDRTAAWTLLMIYTGMMPGEAMALTVPMIDFESQTITGAGLKTATRKQALIHFPQILVPVLKFLIGDCTEGKLFPRNKDMLYKDYHAMTARIGIRDLEPYSCRHTMATAMALDKNVSPELLRKIMRWSKTSNMASRYVHPDDEDIRTAVEIKFPE